ncbi:MAG: OFA family MFS transporter [Candidatus Pacebacteria bacterium]|jgi:OFA family oxalate/formate antiporter-like MFS transporter|nr:OFA family MFS transporter [Candidatus Paceibacterota bacterium]
MTYNRWLVVLGALLVQISLGAIYIYSVFKPALKNQFPDWSATDLALPAQIVLACNATAMIIAGRLQDRFGPRIVAIFGAFFLLAGMLVASRATSLMQFILGYGILSGAGIGSAYVCPIAACTKWFPDKRGLVTGLAVAGFGAGGLVFAPLASYFISVFGVMTTFLYLGLIYFCAVVTGAFLLKNPQAGYCPAGWTPPAGNAKNAAADLTPRQMLARPRFWILWLTYFTGATAGLLVIMNATNIWQSIGLASFSANAITANEFAQIAGQGVLAVMIIAIFNSLGRIAWGLASDRIGRPKTLLLLFSICGASLIMLTIAGAYPLFLLFAALIGFCFGGFLALYPAVTADFFGTRNIGSNYGLMFSAYGVAGLVGPWLGPKLVSGIKSIPYETTSGAVKTIETGSYADSFLLAGLLCFAAAIIVARSVLPRK